MKGTAYERGNAWLKHNQRRGGGWSPKLTIDITTWVTSLVLLALSEATLGPEAYHRAIEWTVGQMKPELNPVERFVFRMRGMPRGEQTNGGSPWFPGTAAWIGPTAISVLALSEAVRRNDD